MIMITNMDVRKSLPIAYCMFCLLICITVFGSAFLDCYISYQENHIVLVTTAKIVSLENIDSTNWDYTLGQIGTEVGIYNIKGNKCDICYKDTSYKFFKIHDEIYYRDMPLENLSYNQDEYEELTGKKLSVFGYFYRIIRYTPNQAMHGFVGADLERKVYQYFYVLSVLLIFDVLYLAYKIKSKKFEVISLFMNGIMCVANTFWLFINVLGIFIR